MALWPTSVATDADLYVAVNSLQTTLSTALGTGDVTVVLASATGFPVAGAVTIDNEVIFYTNISGSSLTGCTRGADGTTAATHSVGVPVGAAIVAFHHNGLKNEIEAIETYLSANIGTGATPLTASRALATNSSKKIVASAVLDTELAFLAGVTSAIQTQIDLKAPKASPTFTGTVVIPTPFTLGAVSVTATGTEMNYLVGVTSAIQTQLGTKAPTANPTFTGNALFGDGLEATPGIAFSADPDCGMFREAANRIAISAGGVNLLYFRGDNTPKRLQPTVIIQAIDGSVSAPTYSFDSDPDCGIYRIGANNWAFATNGAKIWETSSAGAITQPLQPSFLVTDGTGATDVTGDGTTYTLLWPTEVYDQGSNFASHVFTAPVTGRYLLSAHVFARQIGSAHTSAYLSIVTTAREYRDTWTMTSGTVTGIPLKVTAIADMTAGDTAIVQLNVSGGTKIVDVDNDAKQNYFSGSLIN